MTDWSRSIDNRAVKLQSLLALVIVIVLVLVLVIVIVIVIGFSAFYSTPLLRARLRTAQPALRSQSNGATSGWYISVTYSMSIRKVENWTAEVRTDSFIVCTQP